VLSPPNQPDFEEEEAPFTAVSCCEPHALLMYQSPTHLLRFPAVVAALLASTVASAQAAVPGPGQVYSLTPQGKAAVLSASAEATAEAARAGPSGGGADRQIHGEVGAMIGTQGARSAYGFAAVPLGERAGAVVSFESSRFGNGRRR
jgi:hypothetical protein